MKSGLFRILLLASFWHAASLSAAINGLDNFNDNSKDATKWGADIPYGHGVLTETSQRLQYTVSAPTLGDEDDSYRPWISNQATYDTDWEVLLDVHNGVTPTVVGQVTSLGIEVFETANLQHSVYVELYASALDQLPMRRGFKSALTVTSEIGFSDTLDLGLTDGAIRLAFNAQTKVIKAFYAPNGSVGGYTWKQFGSFGVNGSGGTNGNAQWNMAGSQAFQTAIYGYDSNIGVSSGQMYADNFSGLTGALSPAIKGVKTNGALLLSWPQSAIGYTLEGTVPGTPGWMGVANAPVLSNGTYFSSQPLSGVGRLFRLNKF